jgi:hypothetical protein
VKTRTLLVALLALGRAVSGPAGLAAEEETIPMADDPRTILRRSTDQRALVTAALALARSQEPPDHAELVRALGDEQLLHRLDTDDEVRNLRYRLRVERVTEALAENRAPSAHGALAALTSSSGFTREPRRVDALIRATAAVRPAPPPIVAFWDRYSQPEDGYGNVTIHAAIENGSPPAIALFERKMLDPGHPDDDKVAWLRGEVVPHRDDAPLLDGFDRLLASGLPVRLKSEIVDVLFDYRPDEWYSEAAVMTPPDRTKASSASRAALRRVAERALMTLSLTPRQETLIAAATGVRPATSGSP